MAPGHPLSICLAYTDLPGRALQNNLNLTVQKPGSPRKIVGNSALPQKVTPFDCDNNVERVRIEDPEAGEYLIQVSAANLLNSDGQAFALVVSGKLTSDLRRI